MLNYSSSLDSVSYSTEAVMYVCFNTLRIDTNAR